MTVDSGLLGVRSISFSPVGGMIAAGCYNGKIYLVDALTGQVKRLVNVDSWVRSVSYSPFGDTIVVGCDNGNVLLVDAVTVTVKRSVRGHSDR